jgi:hemerythrin-like domain-containing protein
MLMAIHGAARRDLERSQQAVAALMANEGARESGVQAVQEYYSRFVALLEHHHQVEDDEVWPHLEQVSALASPGWSARWSPSTTMSSPRSGAPPRPSKS